MYSREVLNSLTVEEKTKILVNSINTRQFGEIALDIIDKGGLLYDIINAAKHKKNRDCVHAIIGDTKDLRVAFENSDSKIYNEILNISIITITESLVICNRTPKIIIDNPSGKVRKIIKPRFEDEQIIHHALIRGIMNTLSRGMSPYTYASIPGRGLHKARFQTEKYIRKDTRGTKYVLKLDIHKFFNSIDLRILKKKLKRYIKDRFVRRLIDKILSVQDKGLPLGFYTSQWFANYYLQDLDHYIKERILDDLPGGAPTRNGKVCHGIKYYIRYMDDMVLMSSNKKELHEVKNIIERYLWENLHLKLNEKWQVFKLATKDKRDNKYHGSFLDFVGFRFYRDKITIRNRNYKKIMKIIKIIEKGGYEAVTPHIAASFLSYYGFIKYSDSKGLYKKFLKPYISLNEIKDIVGYNASTRKDNYYFDKNGKVHKKRRKRKNEKYFLFKNENDEKIPKMKNIASKIDGIDDSKKYNKKIKYKKKTYQKRKNQKT